jgi:hypothetical protein
MPENTSIQIAERCGSVEERLERLETAQRERDIEYRLLSLEGSVDSSDDESDEADESNEAEVPRLKGRGEEAFYLALTDLIKSGAVAQIIDLFKQSFEHKAKETEAQRKVTWKAHVLGLVFGALIFGAVCALRWHDKITQELAAGLIGTLIGYWYGHERGR